MKTDVRKRMKNETLCGRHFLTISRRFWRPRPQKSVQKRDKNRDFRRRPLSCIVSAERSLFEVQKSPVPDRFGSVLGPPNRPKTVPRRSPKRVQRPASFCNRFATDSRSCETQKYFKNIRKIDDFAKLGFAPLSQKNVNFGYFGGPEIECEKRTPYVG